MMYLFQGLIFLLSMIICSKMLNADELNDSKSEDKAQVEVRAVFINCEPNKRSSDSIDNCESTRFERDELYKYSALQSCNKKLALTVKISSEPELNSDDEYIPIEHVIEGTQKKRQRLLNPYILRLRREPALQAYKLRKIDIVSGILSNSDKLSEGDDIRKRARLQRDLKKIMNFGSLKIVTPKYGDNGNVSMTLRGLCQVASTSPAVVALKDSHVSNIGSEKRIKRHEHNIIVEQEINEVQQNTPWVAGDYFYRRPHSGIIPDILKETPQVMTTEENKYRRSTFFNINNDIVKSTPRPMHHNVKYRHNSEIPNSRDNGHVNTPSDTYKEKSIYLTSTFSNDNMETKKRKTDLDSKEMDFALYEIGEPELWYSVDVQLYEKISTPEGKTIWNDITKGEPASISSLSPEWTGQDLSLRYQSGEWMARNEFSLPSSGLCLMTPLRDDTNTFVENGRSVVDSEYIVVPANDIVGLEDTDNHLKKLDRNFSESQFTTSGSQNEQNQRRVIVRTARALFGGGEDRLGMATHGEDQYLTLPHRRRHHAQIDLEARADENQLVCVGSVGRIATIVADSTRAKRIALTVQATNTGLAAARFRAVTRDCNPELAGLFNEKVETSTTNPSLIPPRHTRRFRLEIPIEIPIDVAHCSVALMNDDDETVAVRDVAIKRGDRCFCVWHCDCVCLSEDPKLLCREMSESRQTAAGLEVRNRPRLTRTACYPDIVSVNLFVIVIGVLMALIFLGLVKACLGLLFRCIGSWGLDRLVQMPRRLDRYYETSLRSRPVEYDEEGWPIHPDSKERTVRLVSKSMEFVLNLIFFVTIPCVATYEIVKRIASLFKTPEKKDHIKIPSKNNQECFSTHDVQGLESRWRRRRDGLRKWMTPGAQELSTDIWKKGLAPQGAMKCEFMQPLLQKETQRGDSNNLHDSYIDSEQDDTEYVLMQMQKSRESLAKTQKKFGETGIASVKQLRKCDAALTKK